MRLIELITPKPFRGDVIAAGVVVLVIAAGLFELRAIGRLEPWARVAILGAGWAFVTAIAWRAPREQDEPRAYQSVLYAGALLMLLLMLGALGQALGSDGWLRTSGQSAWAALAITVQAAIIAQRRNSGLCTLIAAVAFALTASTAFLALRGTSLAPAVLDDPERISKLAPLRWLLLAITVAYVLNAVRLRDRRRRHAVAFAEAAGVTLLAIALMWTGSVLPLPVPDGPVAPGGPAWGWSLLLLAGGFGLVAYGGVDRERGPVWIGALVLLHVAVLERDGGLFGWPVVLLAAAALLLWAGLRGTKPAPPPPDAGGPVAETVPLRRFRRRDE